MYTVETREIQILRKITLEKDSCFLDTAQDQHSGLFGSR